MIRKIDINKLVFCNYWLNLFSYIVNVRFVKDYKISFQDFKMGKVTNIEYGNIDFEKVNFESLISTRL